MIDTQQKVKLADLQIEQLSRMKKHSNFTHVEITSLPNSTRMYEGAGRMYVHPLYQLCVKYYVIVPFVVGYYNSFLSSRFILQSKDEISNQLLEKQKTADEKIKELEVSLNIWSIHRHKKLVIRKLYVKILCFSGITD